MTIPLFSKLNINKVVRVLVITDFFYNSAFGSFAPIFAIFITGQIAGGSAKVAGFATAVYWVVKSAVQLPIARLLDRKKNERVDFFAMFFGYLLAGTTVFGYLFARTPSHLYLIQGVFGFAMAWAVPAWYKIFTRHVDKWEIAFEWSLESVFSVGVATAGSAALGGYLADRFGFEVVFLAAGTLAVISSFFLLFLKNKLLPPDHVHKIYPERHPHRS